MDWGIDFKFLLMNPIDGFVEYGEASVYSSGY